MSDIVERLRDMAKFIREGDDDGFGPSECDALEAAANAIERLRHDLANAQMKYDCARYKHNVDLGLIKTGMTADEAHRRYIENDY